MWYEQEIEQWAGAWYDGVDYGEQMLITPVPGGVGLMTRVALLENLVYGGN